MGAEVLVVITTHHRYSSQRAVVDRASAGVLWSTGQPLCGRCEVLFCGDDALHVPKQPAQTRVQHNPKGPLFLGVQGEGPGARPT